MVKEGFQSDDSIACIVSSVGDEREGRRSERIRD
jgi:hypothetical protein